MYCTARPGLHPAGGRREFWPDNFAPNPSVDHVGRTLLSLAFELDFNWKLIRVFGDHTKTNFKSGGQECLPHGSFQSNLFLSRKYAAVSTTMYTALLISVR